MKYDEIFNEIIISHYTRYHVKVSLKRFENYIEYEHC